MSKNIQQPYKSYAAAEIKARGHCCQDHCSHCQTILDTRHIICIFYFRLS